MAQFSRRDYLWLAERLRADLQAAQRLQSANAREQAISSIYRWAEALAAENPRGFDAELFIANCQRTQT